MKPELMNALTLAYIGDAVFEVLVRDDLVARGISKVDTLQKTAVDYVSAHAQAHFMHEALAHDWLSDEEIRIYKRGRNTKGRRVKNTLEHNESTGFEALIGTLHIVHNEQRINEIYELYKSVVLGNK